MVTSLPTKDQDDHDGQKIMTVIIMIIKAGQLIF
jgi:hypothetical protein